MKCKGIDIVDSMPNSVSRARVGLVRTAVSTRASLRTHLGDRHKSPLLLSLTRPDLRKVVTEVRLDSFIR